MILISFKQVDEDGAIWLGWHCDDLCPVPTPSFPVQPNKQMVACFWADNDNSIDGSQVYYRLANDTVSWNKAQSYLSKATGGSPPFDYTATNKLLIIATWVDMAYDGGNAATPVRDFDIRNMYC